MPRGSAFNRLFGRGIYCRCQGTQQGSVRSPAKIGIDGEPLKSRTIIVTATDEPTTRSNS
jgi:hypothetical protein